MVTSTTLASAPPADQSGPNLKSSDYQAMAAYWDLIRSILGGAESMRAAGTLYLPRFPAETMQLDPNGRSIDPYEIRRLTAPFTNVYEDIVRSLASKPFSKEVRMKDGTPQRYRTLAENIDGQGNNLHVFAQEAFTRGINNAFHFIFVDYPRAVTAEGNRPLSVTEESKLGLRPYWVQVPADRVLAVYSDFIGGIEVLTHVRIYEPIIVLDGFVERHVERVRVLNRMPIAFDQAGKPSAYGAATWDLWELVIQASTDSGAWVVIDTGVFTLGVIPLIRFATGQRLGRSYQYNPALRGVAEMQVQAFQQEANLKNIMELTCFPVLAGDGINPPTAGEATSIMISPRAVLYGGWSAEGRPGQWKFIEPSGTSVKIVADRLEKIHADMHDLGMQPMIQSNLTVITTGQVAQKANSALQAWTLMFKDALEQAWELTAQWFGSTDEPEVELHTDFAAIVMDPTQMGTLQAMRINKDLSQESILDAAIRFDLLPSDFDIELNKEQLAEEQQGLVPEQPIDPRTGLPIQPPQPGQPGQPPQPPQPPPGQPPQPPPRRSLQ